MRLILLLLLAGLLVAEEPRLTARRELPVRLSTSHALAEIAEARLWASDDNGRNWQEVDRVQLAPEATEAPVLRFRVPHDGTWGLATSILLRDGSHEPGPAAGTPPEAHLRVRVDTRPPVFTRAELDGSGDTLRLRWQAADPHLAADPVTLELASTSEEWRTVATGLPAAGERPLRGAPAAARLRLRAVDRAGNIGHSQVLHLPEIATDPADEAIAEPATTATTSAVEQEQAGELLASLPSLMEADLEAAREQLDLSRTDSQRDDAEKKEKKQKAQGRHEVPPDHQDVIAPHAGSPAPRPRLPPPAPRLQPAGIDQGGPSQPEQILAQAMRGEPLTPRYAPLPEPRTAAHEISLPARRVLAELGSGVLVGEHSRRALQAARSASSTESAVALALYRRLRDSDLAAEALPDEARLLHEQGQSVTAIDLLAQAPPEARSDAATLLHAELLLATKQAQAAERVANRLPLSSPQRRAADFLRARALMRLDRPEQARSLLRNLASGNDDIAHQARQALAR